MSEDTDEMIVKLRLALDAALEDYKKDQKLRDSASELLAALRKAQNTLSGLGYPSIADDICAAAIAKAEGRS